MIHSIRKSAFLLLLFIPFGSGAQIIDDVVSQEASYANQVWYSLENGEVLSAPKTEWDIAFSTGAFSSSIHINSTTGNILKVYPNGDINDWGNVDISGFDNWPALTNSATSWQIGAFDQNPDGSELDFSWGVYNPVTHFVNGDSLYILQTADGNFKKLRINNLTLQGVYNFDIADTDGQNEHSVSVQKSEFSGKLFGYYHVASNTIIDREPDSSSWDLLFTQYTDYVPTAYTVAGVLHHPDVMVAQVDDVNTDTFEDYINSSFSSEINTIGYDWKSFNGMAFDIASDRVYFVQAQNGAIWKLVFTGFGGSSNGNYEFTKQLLSDVRVTENEKISVITTYPNPATNSFTLVFSAQGQSSASFTITDLSGKVCLQSNIASQQGLNTHNQNIEQLESGIYIVTLTAQNQRLQTKLIVE